MGLFARMKRRRQPEVTDSFEEAIRKTYVAAGCDETLAYTMLYDDLVDKKGLDIATVITLIQIAIFIWQWFKQKNTSAAAVMTTTLPSFDFADEHEEALTVYGQKLGLAA